MKKTAIVGAGAISYRHADALTQLGVKILGIVDVNPESAQRLADAYGTVVVSDLAQIAGDLGMVHICTGLLCGNADTRNDT